MRHQDVAPGFIHTPFNWMVADEDARGALTGLTAGDVNKVALQVSDASSWLLASVDDTGAATWTQLGGGGSATIPTLDKIPAPVADVGLNQKKLTNVGDATNARDAVNLETLEAALPIVVAGLCAYITQNSDGSWPLRNTVTSIASVSVDWRAVDGGANPPPQGNGYALPGDTYKRFPSGS